MNIKRYNVQEVTSRIHDRYEMFLTFRRMLDEMGLGEWIVTSDKAVTRLGACWHMRKRISLSETYIRVAFEHNNVIELVRTFLHEVAHAFAGFNAHHGAQWRRNCAMLGLDIISAKHRWGNINSSPRAAAAKWKVVHCETGEVFQYFIKKPRRTDFSGSYAIGRKAETLGKLVLKKVVR